MARHGYGLLLPDVRRTYSLSPAQLGLIGTGSYASYLLATAATRLAFAAVALLAAAWAARVLPRRSRVATAAYGWRGVVCCRCWPAAC